MYHLKAITFVILLIQVLTSAKSLPKKEERIVGGEPAKITELPFQAFLGNCGGSIISTRHILTAAHCLPLGFEAKVLVGTAHLIFGGQLYNVSSAKKHEQFQSGAALNNDIAIVTLAEDIQFTEKVQLIKLADSGSEVPDGADLTVSGWGSTEVKPHHRISLKLRKVTVPKVSDASCKKAYSGKQIVTETMLCAGVSGKAACHGDSGGPIIQKTPSGNIQVGVVSWSYGCADPKYPTVYAKVSALREWIDENTKL